MEPASSPFWTGCHLDWMPFGLDAILDWMPFGLDAILRAGAIWTGCHLDWVWAVACGGLTLWRLNEV